MVKITESLTHGLSYALPFYRSSTSHHSRYQEGTVVRSLLVLPLQDNLWTLRLQLVGL